MDVPHVAMWVALYAELGERGWAPWEVDLMDCPTAATFAGRGPDKDTEYRSVIRGTRSVIHRGEDDTDDQKAKRAQEDLTAQREAMLDPSLGEERPVARVRPQRPDDR